MGFTNHVGPIRGIRRKGCQPRWRSKKPGSDWKKMEVISVTSNTRQLEGRRKRYNTNIEQHRRYDLLKILGSFLSLTTTMYRPKEAPRQEVGDIKRGELTVALSLEDKTEDSRMFLRKNTLGTQCVTSTSERERIEKGKEIRCIYDGGLHSN